MCQILSLDMQFSNLKFSFYSWIKVYSLIRDTFNFKVTLYFLSLKFYYSENIKIELSHCSEYNTKYNKFKFYCLSW